MASHATQMGVGGRRRDEHQKNGRTKTTVPILVSKRRVHSRAVWYQKDSYIIPYKIWWAHGKIKMERRVGKKAKSRRTRQEREISKKERKRK